MKKYEISKEKDKLQINWKNIFGLTYKRYNKTVSGLGQDEEGTLKYT